MIAQGTESAGLVKTWIWVSAAASLAGWVLSAVGGLTLAGYVVFAAASVLFFLWRRPACGVSAAFRLSKLRFRFRHFLPACFLLLAALALIGGLLYAPTNHAGLTYRVSRVLQWLADGQWFWIHTPNYRMNNRACGMEWLSAPLLLFTKSDRLLFLINFVPFLLLPGLIYSVFTRLGVKARVAWHWMWILPGGYSFLLQAGSIANDTFPAVYALAAVDFALRARSSGRASDVWYSVFAAALLTGAKASNLPLLLPWAVALAPSLRLFLNRPVPGLLLAGAAAVVSFLPTAVLNIVHCGTWSGLNLERAGMEMKDPVVGIWGNSLLFLLHNFVPPFFPQAGWWNQSAPGLLPRSIVEPLNANFEAGYHLLWELPTEDWVGLGFGVSVLAAVSFVAAGLRGGVDHCCATRRGIFRTLVLLSPWLALLAYCMKSGMVTGARLISPYYPLLLPALLLGAGQAALVRRRWWQGLAAGVMLLAVPVLVVSPARPLFPAITILQKLHERHPDSHLFTRGLKAYAVYRDRADALAGVRQLLPPGLKTVGFLADGDDLDISLWRPFFARRVHHVLLKDSGSAIRSRGIEYVVVGGAYLRYENANLERWLKEVDGRLLASTSATIKVSEGPQPWYVVQLR